MARAVEEAAGRSQRVETTHLVLAAASQLGTAAAAMLAAHAIDRTAVETLLPRPSTRTSGHTPFSSRAKRSFELALREALARGDDHIGTGHLLIGVLLDTGDHTSSLLVRSGLTVEAARTQLKETEPADTDRHRSTEPEPEPPVFAVERAPLYAAEPPLIATWLATIALGLLLLVALTAREPAGGGSRVALWAATVASVPITAYGLLSISHLRGPGKGGVGAR